jgi:1,2-dihydroxy-3-keto-5-methylthiopentene dioxygenase
MAVVRIPDENRTLRDSAEITAYLAHIGIDYERWDLSSQLPAQCSNEEILTAYAREIDGLKQRGGYVAVDVVDVTPQTPGLDDMLAKFNREHWHSEDEVRFIVEGRGIFHVHPPEGMVAAIEVEAGDLIRVPAGTWHWFNLCADRRIRAIRLFRDPGGWIPEYTGSGTDQAYQPICLGPAYFPASSR